MSEPVNGIGRLSPKKVLVFNSSASKTPWGCPITFTKAAELILLFGNENFRRLDPDLREALILATKALEYARRFTSEDKL